MDNLLYNFYTRKLVVEATGATNEQLIEFTNITHLKWACGKYLYELTNCFRGNCFLYATMRGLTKKEIQRKIDSGLVSEIYYSTFNDYHLNSVTIEEFLDFYRLTKEIKPVSDEEIQVIWG